MEAANILADVWINHAVPQVGTVVSCASRRGSLHSRSKSVKVSGAAADLYKLKAV